MTSTTFAPATLQANSMLPRMSGLATLPATRLVENVADAQVHDGLRGRPRIDAAQQNRHGVLARGARALLRQVIVIFARPGAEAFVAFLHERQDLVRRQLVALRLAHRHRVDDPTECSGADEARRSEGQRSAQETAAATG